MYQILIAINMNTYHNDIPCVYIEKTTETLQQRKMYHYLMSQQEQPTKEFHRVVKHLGPSVFRWEVLATTDSQEKANHLEKFYQKEYKSQEIGYNREILEQDTGRKGDKRTWDERFGKERAAEIRKKYSKSMSESPKVKAHARARMLSCNPMNNPETRKKAGLAKLGTRNPKARFDYILTSPDGEELVIPCLNEFAREHEGITAHGVWVSLQKGRKYKGWSVKRVPKSERDGV